MCYGLSLSEFLKSAVNSLPEIDLVNHFLE